ncbi:hypothetical protein Fmac_005881 [Flemingia macrophylla]|uniref:Secreted protein n=1 Tax=Flemingia macrophylla TaxID=520843 RepID=A0ABD1N9K1_9FABA
MDCAQATSTAMYLALSAVERATQACFLLCHDTKHSPNIWHVPLVLFLSNLQPAKSASLKPTKLEVVPLGYHRPQLIVPLRYFNIFFTAVI